MANNAFGIDLGTSNIKIYNRTEMFEKTPGNIHITYPLSNGVIADIQNMETLIKYFMIDLMKGNIRPADYYIAVPWDVTEVEKRAFKDLVKESNVKAKKVMVVDKAVADGLGLGIDVKNSQGVLVVNVGFDTTEISILSLGGIVLSKLVKVGGRKFDAAAATQGNPAKFDEAIKSAVRREYSLIIGGKTAENVKIALTELEAQKCGAVVYGRDIVTGLPVEREIPISLVDECLTEHFNTIIDNIKVILERTPPELAADIYRHGVYLTGGASQVNKLAKLMSKGTGLKVNVSEHPIESVALGIAKIINEDNYKSVAYAIEGMSK